MPSLFGPNGHPLVSSADHKRDNAPPEGPAFGRWSGRDVQYAGFPGGNALLQFDLDALTMSDFRAMKEHPTINSSLSVLTFMLHQVDWHIECENQKIADMVEANMRSIWTRLVRAMSTAFWSGYSPNVLEYENNSITGYTEITKVKDLVPEECEVHWKEVAGSYAPPGKMKPKFQIYDGIDQWGAPFPVPPQNTFWYPLLMENGNYYGRKLLKPAFMPWYFSLLIHLFSNRYFERFGEPTIYGRAPFDEDITTTNSQGEQVTKSGRQVMEDILTGLRNRSVVVLPSERDPSGAQSYTWDISYLESQMRGADFERYMGRLDEEMSMALFTPLLLLRTGGGDGSFNLGVQHTQCVHPDTKILCSDLIWRRAGDLKPGQEVVSFDEDADSGGRGQNARAYRTGVIEWNIPAEKPSMTVTTDLSGPVTSSADHPWLVWRRRTKSEYGNSNMGLQWVETQNLQVGDKIAHLAQPWDTDESYDAGWLSGMFDGEGSLVRRGTGTNGIELVVCQNDGPVLDRLKQTLTDRGFTFVDSQPAPTGHGSGRVHRLRISGGLREVMRLVGTLRPLRFLAKTEVMWEGFGLRQNQTFDLATVESVEDVGMQPVASIQVSNGTFIAEGLLAHNTWLWMLNALTGDMAEYINRYVCDRLKAINFTPNAPECKWVPKKMGRESVETLRAVITALITANKVKPDVEQLGQALGMTLTEIKEVTADTAVDGTVGTDASPPVDNRPRTERDRSGGGPKGVGEPRATGRQISNRITGQVEKAFRDGKFDKNFKPSMGFKRRMEQSLQSEGLSPESAIRVANDLYGRMERWIETTVELGPDEFAGPSDYMALFDRRLDLEIESLRG